MSEDTPSNDAGVLIGVPHAVVKAHRRGRVWDKCGGRCHYCGCALHPFWTFTVDHLVPKSRGGTNALDNLVAACPACNTAKGDSLCYLPADLTES